MLSSLRSVALKILLIIFTFLFLIFYFLGRGGEAREITWGATFDPYYAERLDLDWRKTYLTLLDDLKVGHLRLVAFWNRIEPEKDQLGFADLDFQFAEAEKRGVKITLALGRRLPRWPECHVPTWAQTLAEARQQEEVLELIPAIVNRYKDSPALEVWQVENESFVIFFTGKCPSVDESFLDREIALVRQLDPTRSVMITESGEGSTWFKASGKTGLLGVSLYRVIYADQLLYKGYYDYFLPVELFRIKSNLWKALGRLKEIWVTELQAEPFLPNPITPETSLAEFYRSLSPEQFQENIAFARSTGFNRFYFWGVEWWVYMKEKVGVDYFWEEAKKLWQSTQ